MKKDSKIALNLHWKRGFNMVSSSSPYLRFAVGTAILVISIGLAFATVFISAPDIQMALADLIE